MNDKFLVIDVKSIEDNVFKLIGTDWMLITAGTRQNFNTMTASWGTLGVLWNKPVAICFIRPQRHTFSFVDTNEYYTLNFFADEYRSILNFCGTHSGRDTDKIKVTGLIPVELKNGNILFEQARLVLECKKLYAEDIKPEKFVVPELLSKIYASEDYHRFFIGEIVHCYVHK